MSGDEQSGPAGNYQPSTRLERLRLDLLDLDPENPRLSPTKEPRSQTEIARLIEEKYDALAVARSIVAHGYFPSEPLIATSDGNDRYVVLEGNRRLVALKALSDEEFRRSSFTDSSTWDELAAGFVPPDDVPVVVVDSWSEAAPIIGFRHIAGIEPWDSFAKARFIARLVDSDDYSFEEVANVVGEQTSDVRAAYRNYHLVTEARSNGVDVSRAESGFGVFSRALTSSGLRTHVGAPQPRSVQKGAEVLPPANIPQFAELVSWLFGDDSNGPVIEESREVDKLGRAVATDDGLEVLRATRDLSRSVEASRGRRQRLLSRLQNARNALLAAVEDFEQFRDDEDVRLRLAEVEAALNQILADASRD